MLNFKVLNTIHKNTKPTEFSLFYRLYNEFEMHRAKNEDCYISIQYLVENTNITKKTIIEKLKVLEKLNYVTIQRRTNKGEKITSIYTINEDYILSLGGAKFALPHEERNNISGVNFTLPPTNNDDLGGVIYGNISGVKISPRGVKITHKEESEIKRKKEENKKENNNKEKENEVLNVEKNEMNDNTKKTGELQDNRKNELTSFEEEKTIVTGKIKTNRDDVLIEYNIFENDIDEVLNVEKNEIDGVRLYEEDNISFFDSWSSEKENEVLSETRNEMNDETNLICSSVTGETGFDFDNSASVGLVYGAGDNNNLHIEELRIKGCAAPAPAPQIEKRSETPLKSLQIDEVGNYTIEGEKTQPEPRKGANFESKENNDNNDNKKMEKSEYYAMFNDFKNYLKTLCRFYDYNKVMELAKQYIKERLTTLDNPEMLKLTDDFVKMELGLEVEEAEQPQEATKEDAGTIETNKVDNSTIETEKTQPVQNIEETTKQIFETLDTMIKNWDGNPHLNYAKDLKNNLYHYLALDESKSDSKDSVKEKINEAIKNGYTSQYRDEFKRLTGLIKLVA